MSSLTDIMGSVSNVPIVAWSGLWNQQIGRYVWFESTEMNISNKAYQVN